MTCFGGWRRWPLRSRTRIHPICFATTADFLRRPEFVSAFGQLRRAELRNLKPTAAAHNFARETGVKKAVSLIPPRPLGWCIPKSWIPDRQPARDVRVCNAGLESWLWRKDEITAQVCPWEDDRNSGGTERPPRELAAVDDRSRGMSRLASAQAQRGNKTLAK